MGSNSRTGLDTRILITGSRSFSDRGIARAGLECALDLLDQHPKGTTVVHGAAYGADRILAHQARRLGMRIEAHPADWRAHGGSAGLRRNAEMIAAGADVVLAFPMHPRGSTKTAGQRDVSAGTWHCAGKAAEAGLAVLIAWEGDLVAHNRPGRKLLGAERRSLHYVG